MRAIIDEFENLPSAAARYRKRRTAQGCCAVCGRSSRFAFRCAKCRRKHRRAMRDHLKRGLGRVARQNRRRLIIYHYLRSRGYPPRESRRYGTSVSRAVSSHRPEVVVKSNSIYRAMQKLETAIKRSSGFIARAPMSETVDTTENSLLREMFGHPYFSS
jgi:hypothetical protein